MGAIIIAKEFNPNNKGLYRPIIYCTSNINVASKSEPINALLAEQLIKYPANRRTMNLERCFNQVLLNFPDEVIIKNFDVMFNPAYRVDVLKIMIAAYKKKSFNVIWPGSYENGKLYYAQEEYLDYKVFSIKDYDITCIV